MDPTFSSLVESLPVTVVLWKSWSSFNEDQDFHNTTVTVLGDHLAFYSSVEFLEDDDLIYPYWSLHVWNWCEGGQSNVGVSFHLLLKGLI
jgi:hypothetical protein